MKIAKTCTLMLAVVFVLLFSAACSAENNSSEQSQSIKDEALEWAQNLKVDDVVRIEAFRYYTTDDTPYQNFGPSEFARIVEIINASKGNRLAETMGSSGAMLKFYITTADGTMHTYENASATYLVIDGITYEADYAWLASWMDFQLNEELPDDFYWVTGTPS